MSDLIKRIKQKPDEFNDRLSAQLRYQQKDRWIARTRDELGLPCETWEQIKFDDPEISLEWKLCDMANIVMLQSEKMRPKFIESLTDAEREYLNRDPEALDAFIKTPLVKQLLKRRK